MKRLLVRDLLTKLNFIDNVETQSGPGSFEQLSSYLLDIVVEFSQANRLSESYFIKGLKEAFKTSRFECLLKRWLVEYFVKLFKRLDDLLMYQYQFSKELSLEDNPLNRFGVEKYYSRFGTLPKITWYKSPGVLQKILSILCRQLFVLYLSLKEGLKIWGKRKRYKIMREAIWGLYDIGGYYFHDDFLVDGDRIKKEDILLYSRGLSVEKGRLKAYHDAKKSPYMHFNLQGLSLGIRPLFSRIIPKYIFSGSKILFKEIFSVHFSLYWSIYLYFIYNALPYEKVFSHFKIISELAHNYFSAGHIVEAIICQNYGARYYLMHWSDNSVVINKYATSFLGCDGFLLWGKAHIQAGRRDSSIFMPTGYVFKRFVNTIVRNRDKTLFSMGIRSKGKIVTFFDESFAGDVKMTEGHYVTFWETALKFAETEKDNTVLIKPKVSDRYNKLSPDLKERFISIKNQMERMSNVHIIDSYKWSFIEAIGVSDIVITQGMTSSATIAIICGIQGLYLDQVGFNHPFSEAYRNRLVFGDPEELLLMVKKIIDGKENPLKEMPEHIIRHFDAYPDDRGIDLFRSILSSGAAPRIRKKVGIIVQARMGSTRLPGKVMKPILNKPMLQILIERLKRCKKVDTLIVATSKNKNNDVIEKLANRLGVACFRGKEDDVLDRYYEAAKEYRLDVIVRITSDCPLTDPLLVDDLITFYFDNLPIDYVSNAIKRTYPRGYDIEVFSFESLKKAAMEDTRPYHREHVTPFIRENMKLLNYGAHSDSSRYRVTVDTIEDFELVTRIFESLNGDTKFSYKQVIDLLDSRPDLVAINQHVKQKR